MAGTKLLFHLTPKVLPQFFFCLLNHLTFVLCSLYSMYFILDLHCKYSFQLYFLFFTSCLIVSHHQYVCFFFVVPFVVSRVALATLYIVSLNKVDICTQFIFTMFATTNVFLVNVWYSQAISWLFSLRVLNSSLMYLVKRFCPSSVLCLVTPMYVVACTRKLSLLISGPLLTLTSRIF